jgi:hypothetical protein
VAASLTGLNLYLFEHGYLPPVVILVTVSLLILSPWSLLRFKWQGLLPLVIAAVGWLPVIVAVLVWFPFPKQS